MAGSFEYLFVFWCYRQLLDKRFLEDLATLINNRCILGMTIDFTINSKGILNVFWKNYSYHFRYNFLTERPITLVYYITLLSICVCGQTAMFFKKQYENRRYHIVVGIAPAEQSTQQQQVNNIIAVFLTCHFNLILGFNIGH